MAILLVVDHPKNWPLHIPGVEIVQSRSYLTDEKYMALENTRVFNLCRSYRYQSAGYYVSLLAAARGHRPLPDVSTIRDLQSPAIIRLTSEDIEDLVRKSLGKVQSRSFQLSIYFGRNMAKRYERLSRALFSFFRAPLLRARFTREKEGWVLKGIAPISVSDVPESHKPFLVSVASEYFAGRHIHRKAEKRPRFYMALLVNPADPHPPSNERALRRFERAAEKLDIEVSRITKDDLSLLPQYDALFIRETTAVNNHTFRFARRAEKEGLVVMDDSRSILRCTNKVFLAESMILNDIPTPRTLVAHRDNLERVAREIGFPCILKQPDSSFSEGVMKVNTNAELLAAAEKLLEKSELVIAQEFLPTPFDWRIGIIDNRPIYACKYYMAKKHWQIIRRDDTGKVRDEGLVDTMRPEQAPRMVVRTALAAARQIGKGLYGVDLKQHAGKCYVIEVNENPSIDAGIEDALPYGNVYDEIMGVFLRRLEECVQGDAPRG